MWILLFEVLKKVLLCFVEKIKNFLTEFYCDSDSGKGKELKYDLQLVCVHFYLWTVICDVKLGAVSDKLQLLVQNICHC